MSENILNANITPAKYVEQELEEYRGNPFIEALPPILSPEEASAALKFYPPYNESEKNLPTYIRYHAIARVNKFFLPFLQHVELEKRFSYLIRQGYISRNPSRPDFNKAMLGMMDFRSSASSMTLMGFSGMGKTTAIERILSLYPQVILHEQPYNLLQIVWIKLNCPHDGSLKTLCINFFMKIDQLVGTNYYVKFGSSRNSISNMVIQMGQVAKMHCVGAIVIDEIQHLLDSKGKNLEEMMNYFVTLINEIGVPILMIGTMKTKIILQRDFRQARRGSGIGDMVWEQMKKDDDWDWIVEELWDYQFVKNQTELTDELNEVLYDESQGILDIAVKIFALAQGRAIEDGSEVITPDLLRQVVVDDLKLVRPMLNALRNGHLSELEKYQDIMPMEIEEILALRESKIDLRKSIQKKKEIQEKKRNRKNDDNLVKIFNGLMEFGIEDEVAQKSSVKAINEGKGKNLAELMSIALGYANSINESKIKKNNQKNNINNTRLLTLFEKANINKHSNYEELKNADYIKSPQIEFII